MADDRQFQHVPVPGLAQQQADATHPGFTVTCQKCMSIRVYVDCSLGFSVRSGGWWTVDLRCANCGAGTAVVGSG